ncbi:uncharacterized protein DSM5745_05732 [Aspergillus mulundensis]|uniref:Enoyl reductase (ER) domain-containing protein n=1 Tax=Aspergillus mulundensis TaxID=1810919 RepID=A0A3D8RYE3_9EURO|nr:hypothetical protein DSM5745_05732 [Aspergillus mulundensis]RDW78880.1 hypothetical protein DSM5745_05732 [Aspergillus mulundensis]
MSLPVTQARAYRRTADGSRIELVTDELPKSLAPDEVLIKIRAVSLNHRDVGMLKATKFSAPLSRGVPCCNCADGVIGTVNYAEHPNWGQEVRRLTDGKGADVVLDIGGQVSISRVSMLCELGDGVHGWLPGGIHVGSRNNQEALINFLNEHRLPLDVLVDTVFSSEDAEAAFNHLSSKQHVGRVVVRVQ